tara:strand:- start:134 stop:697 length:564 start_codon:yes stop_codon:yes gene_type:complete
MLLATQQIITNCSMGVVDGTTLPLFALQKIFMDLRSASVSNIIELNLVCGECDTKYDHELDLQALEITYDPEHTSRIKLDEQLIIEMEYPSAGRLAELFGSETMEELYTTAALCISKIFQGDEIIDVSDVSENEMIEWIENLTLDQFAGIRSFFETMPVLEHTFEFDCLGCGKGNYITLNGYTNFFV